MEAARSANATVLRNEQYRRTTGVHSALLDWKLLVRTADREVESFIVVVGMRVVVGADLLIVLIVVAALVDGVGDLGGGVVLQGVYGQSRCYMEGF